RPLFQAGQLGGVQGDDGARIRTAADGVLAEIVGDVCPELGTGIHRHALDHDGFGMSRIRLAHVRVSNALLLHLLFEPSHDVVGFCAYCLVYHDLKNQVGAAFKVQSEMDAVEHRLLESITGKFAGNTKDAVDENQQHCDDDYRLDE